MTDSCDIVNKRIRSDIVSQSIENQEQENLHLLTDSHFYSTLRVVTVFLLLQRRHPSLFDQHSIFILNDKWIFFIYEIKFSEKKHSKITFKSAAAAI